MVTIGALTFDGWIRNKFGGNIKDLKQAIASRLVLPPCSILPQKETRATYVAIDGTAYYADCTSTISDTTTIVANLTIEHPTLPLKDGDTIFIIVEVKNAIFRAVDVYGNYYTATDNEIFPVKIRDEYNQYILKYRFCKTNGTIHSEGTRTFDVTVTASQEKEIVINTCTTAQAIALSSMLGQRTNITDTEVTFSNALITEIRLEYIADDMSDVAVKALQGVDVYKGIVRFKT